MNAECEEFHHLREPTTMDKRWQVAVDMEHV